MSSLSNSKKSVLLPTERFKANAFPQAYVLTVDTPSGSRRLSTKSQLDAMPFEWIFVDGYREESRELRELYSPQKNASKMKRSMTAGEIACYAGHRKVWQKILSSGESHSLVFEDDFQITNINGFLTGLAATANQTDRWDIVKFFDFRPKGVFHKEAWSGVPFVQYKYPASGCVAYVITRRGCRALLQRTQIYRPVDEDISHPWETSLRVWSMNPNPVIDIGGQLGGSLLEANRYQYRRDHRTWRRSLHGFWLTLVKQIHAIRYFQRQKNS